MTTPTAHVIGIAEAAEMLGISERHAYRLAANGELPTIKLGKAIRVPRHRIIELLYAPAMGSGGSGA